MANIGAALAQFVSGFANTTATVGLNNMMQQADAQRKAKISALESGAKAGNALEDIPYGPQIAKDVYGKDGASFYEAMLVKGQAETFAQQVEALRAFSAAENGEDPAPNPVMTGGAPPSMGGAPSGGVMQAPPSMQGPTAGPQAQTAPQQATAPPKGRKLPKYGPLGLKTGKGGLQASLTPLSPTEIQATAEIQGNQAFLEALHSAPEGHPNPYAYAARKVAETMGPIYVPDAYKDQLKIEGKLGEKEHTILRAAGHADPENAPAQAIDQARRGAIVDDINTSVAKQVRGAYGTAPVEVQKAKEVMLNNELTPLVANMGSRELGVLKQLKEEYAPIQKELRRFSAPYSIIKGLAKDKNNPTAWQTAVTTIARLIDPDTGVKEQEAARMEGMPGALNAVKKFIAEQQGKGATPEGWRNLEKVAESVFKAGGQFYRSAIEQKLYEAKEYKINPRLIVEEPVLKSLGVFGTNANRSLKAAQNSGLTEPLEEELPVVGRDGTISPPGQRKTKGGVTYNYNPGQ